MSEKSLAAGNPLEHADLAIPPLHIPDGKGGAFKTELVLKRSKESVEKIQWWHAPDPRPEPHDHPWPFKSTILSGGYTETRYVRFKQCWDVSSHTYRKGDVNDLPAGVFHTVDEVLPGTVTHMVTGAIVEGHDWGYLIQDEVEGLHYVSAKDDPYPNKEFFSQLCAINPHKRQQ